MPQNINDRLERCLIKWFYLCTSRYFLMLKPFSVFIQSAIDPRFRNKKCLCVAGLVILLALYYVYSHRWRNTLPSVDGLHGRCLARELKFLQSLSSSYDAVYNYIPNTFGDVEYPPYVGNGFLAAALNSKNGLFVRLEKSLSLPVNFYPVINVLKSGLELKEAQGVNFLSGYAQKIDSVRWDDGCVTVDSVLYAHQLRRSILVQDISISNPTSKHLTFNLHQIGVSGWAGSQTDTILLKDKFGNQLTYLMSHGVVSVPNSKKMVTVVVATLKINSLISIRPDQKMDIHVISAANYSSPRRNPFSNSEIVKMKSELKKEIEKVLGIDGEMLMGEHSKAWNEMWQSGFSISLSKAQGALNGHHINATFYYVLSNVPHVHGQPSTSPARRFTRDHCYEGYPPTFHASSLWETVKNEEDIARVVTRWLITLEKHGCSDMFYGGSEGVLEALILSIGALRFKKDHLEFAMKPNDLHRDMHFRRIRYDNNSVLNISVEVGKDNKACLYVALDHSDRPFYGCDAGCIDQPVKLGAKRTMFPVKQTEPLTAILYITPNKKHLIELKQVIHVKEINEAPAHEHHVIALHRHGHHFGGLPMLFWVSIAFLIVVFHLFLFKLIYNEYCGAQDRYSTSKYNS